VNRPKLSSFSSIEERNSLWAAAGCSFLIRLRLGTVYSDQLSRGEARNHRWVTRSHELSRKVSLLNRQLPQEALSRRQGNYLKCCTLLSEQQIGWMLLQCTLYRPECKPQTCGKSHVNPGRPGQGYGRQEHISIDPPNPAMLSIHNLLVIGCGELRDDSFNHPTSSHASCIVIAGVLL
jgi:hypothetical protein